MAYVRSAGMRGVREEIESLGGDADVLARRSGLPEGALDDDEILVRDVAIGILLETAAAELRCPDFGLRVALRQDLGMLGPLALAIENAHTTTRALELTSKYLFFHARSIQISVIEDPENEDGILGVRYGYDGSRDDVMPPQVTDMCLLFIHRTVERFLGRDYGIRSVHVPYSLLAPESRYRELFGVPVRADAAEAVLRMPASLLDKPLPAGGRAGAGLGGPRLENSRRAPREARSGDNLGTRSKEAGESASDRTRETLRRSLDTGTSTIGEVAGILAMSSRSLQRALEQEGTSFSSVLDDVRREIAARLVTTTDLPMYQIASAIALGDVTTFSRYARRWWGSTAREFRAATRGDYGAPLAENVGRHH